MRMQFLAGIAQKISVIYIQSKLHALFMSCAVKLLGLFWHRISSTWLGVWSIAAANWIKFCNFCINFICGLQRYIYAPERVAGLSKFDIVKIAGGNQHTLALTRAGNVLSFGRTTYGRLGRLNDDYKSNTARESPAFVDGLYQVEADSIAAGKFCLLTSAWSSEIITCRLVKKNKQ